MDGLTYLRAMAMRDRAQATQWFALAWEAALEMLPDAAVSVSREALNCQAGAMDSDRIASGIEQRAAEGR